MQLTLDLDATTRLPWTGSQLTYYCDYLPFAEHVAAFARWQEEFGVFDSCRRSRMWHATLCAKPFSAANGHSFALLVADLRTGYGSSDELADGESPRDPAWPERLVYQALCEDCEWHEIHDSENAAVEAWHDHAMPGWRDLPAVAFGQRASEQWILDHYPEAWQFSGAPIRTERCQWGTRHHQSEHNPFGGYDLGVPQREPSS